ncbi:MAG TPA: hypothetical protein VMI54_17820, partial [Polyangiaceae bacterium]|nr:hypothetical protein [Polyangiaceae bacterium]
TILSAAERAIVKSLLDGCARKDLPLVRERRPRTIANQIGSIYRKLKLSGRIPLIGYVIRNAARAAASLLAEDDVSWVDQVRWDGVTRPRTFSPASLTSH